MSGLRFEAQVAPGMTPTRVAALAAVVVALVVAGCGGGDGTPPTGGVAFEAAPGTEAPETEAPEPRGDDRAAVSTTMARPPADSAADPAEPEPPATTAATGTETLEATVEAPVRVVDALAEPGESAEEAPAATSATLPAPDEEASAEVTVSEDVPDIEMLDLATGSTVSLRSVVAGDTPLLFWFWSPL